MKTFFLLFTITILVFPAERPKWIAETPKGFTNDYFVGYASSKSSETEAREKALFNAIASIVRNARTTANINQTMQRLQNEQMKNGESVNFDEVTKIATEVVVKGESQTITGLKEEEYYTEYTNGTFTVYTLVKIPKPLQLQSQPPTQSDYLIRSFVPGWAQYYKGHSTKGLLIIGGEAVTLGAGLYFLSLSSGYDSDARTAVTTSDQNFYINKRDNASLTAVSFLIGAGVIYAYNIIDALASEPERVYVEQRIEMDNRFTFSIPQTHTIVSVKIQF